PTLRGGEESSASGREVDVIDVRAAAGQPAQQGERRGDRLLHQVHERLADEWTQAELRVIETAGHRQPDPDDAVAILEQRDGKPQRQLRRVRARDLLAELQLVDDELVIGIEPGVIYFVVQIGIERTARDLVPGEPYGVRSHPR